VWGCNVGVAAALVVAGCEACPWFSARNSARSCARRHNVHRQARHSQAVPANPAEVVARQCAGGAVGKGEEASAGEAASGR